MAPEPDPEHSVVEPAAESHPSDLLPEKNASDTDAASDTGVPRSRAGRHSRLLHHAEAPPSGEEQQALPPPEPEAINSADPGPEEQTPTAATDGATEPETATPSHPHRLEMTIDSLPHHDLTEPIPIYIDPLGDTVFTAAMGNLDISATGNSIGEALLLLKEQIEFIYGDLNRRTKRSPDQTMMLQMLHTYIAPSTTKPAWL